MDKQNVQATRLSRRFLGKTEFTIDRSSEQSEYITKQARHFWQRMHRAYLKGQLTFEFNGYINDPAAKKVSYALPASRQRYYVLQEYYNA